MAIPRVFVSSTCLDLTVYREGAREFIQSYGFIPVLSEHADVYYSPDLHTHENCLREVEKSDLFVLMIGGRVGSVFVDDPTKKTTLVMAEYEAAVRSKLPIFAFVKSNVMRAFEFYRLNTDMPTLDSMKYPGFEDSKHAPKIFGFVEKVWEAETNNDTFEFDVVSDVTDTLKKQWAGMFHEYLHQRSTHEIIEQSNRLLDTLQKANEGTDELLKRLYRSMKPDEAEIAIDEVDQRTTARVVLRELVDVVPKIVQHINFGTLDLSKYEHWYDFVIDISGGSIRQEADGTVVGEWDAPGAHSESVLDGGSNRVNERNRIFQKRFEELKSFDRQVIVQASQETYGADHKWSPVLGRIRL